MKSKLKGITLIETVLYIGLFSVILMMVVSFMLTTQETTTKTGENAALHKTSQFIIQHINYTFESAESIDELGSDFEVDVGKLTVMVNTLPKLYELQNQQIYYDSVAISPPDIQVERFYLKPIYNDTEIVAVRIEILLRDQKNPNLTEEINLLSTFR